MSQPPYPQTPGPEEPDGLPSPWGPGGPDQRTGSGPLPGPPNEGAHEPSPTLTKRPLWLGGLIGLVGMLVTVPLGFRSWGGPWQILGFLAWGIPVVGFGLLFSDTTRRWGAGILLGVGISLIVGFAACVAVFAVYVSSSGQ